MQLQILGSGREVGKSAILLSDKTRVMMDYGVKLQPEPPTYPIKPEKIDATILTHAHLDHSGALPVLFRKWEHPCFMTDVTMDMTNMLLADSLKIAKKNGFPSPFSSNDIKRFIKSTRFTKYNQNFRIGQFNCSLYDAGHIPGSAGIFLQGSKRVFYTGDIQTEDSNLLRKCRLPEKCDVLITESTYSQKDHPERRHVESAFIDNIEEVIANEETALIPVFAIGRAQEILLILEKYANKIALDGMAKGASEIVSFHSSYLKDPRKLKSVLKKVHLVKTREDRLKAAKKYPIIVSSAGMLGGGAAIHYLREIKQQTDSKVLFTGFLVEDSPGWNLIKTKIFENAEEHFKVHCELQQYELSAHTDRSGLMGIIKKLNPEAVVCVHGEHTEEFARDIEEQFPSIQAFAPKNGETIRI